MSLALTMDETPGEAHGLARALEAEIPRLRAFVARLLGRPASSADAEDVLQEVLARAWRSQGAFDRSRALGPWLRATAVRTVIDHRERGGELARERGASSEERAAVPESDTFAEREHVERLLAPLSSVERDVVVRFHQQGESVAEIARALALPEGTVKSHLHRARRKLARRKEVE